MIWRSTQTRLRISNRIALTSYGRAAGAVSDLSYLRVVIGFAYLSVVLDAYSRKIVGWSFHKTLEAKGPLAALEMALASRGESNKSLIHHSDRGVQYCSGAYIDKLRKANVTISMTESGDPNENALAERIFRMLKPGRRCGRI
jgi:transposase InsO family protein